jgi:hypothetical protein
MSDFPNVILGEIVILQKVQVIGWNNILGTASEKYKAVYVEVHPNTIAEVVGRILQIPQIPMQMCSIRGFF